jgi:hypothetical protein
MCVDTCPNGEALDSRNVCKESCNGEENYADIYRKVEGDSLTCTSTLASGEKIFEFTESGTPELRIVSACPPTGDLAVSGNGTDYSTYIYTETRSEQGQGPTPLVREFCVDSCPNLIKDSDNTCVDSCEDEGLKLYDGRCYADCNTVPDPANVGGFLTLFILGTSSSCTSCF